MLLNCNKTKFMQFIPNVSHQPLDTIEINTCKINFTNSFKFWGVIIQSSLMWKEHIDYINLKLNSLKLYSLFSQTCIRIKNCNCSTLPLFIQY
jgi:hypothetical protein